MSNKNNAIFSDAIIESISTHYIGNKTYNEKCYFSKEPYMVSEKVLPVLLKYFTFSFDKNIIYRFFHEADLNLNEIYVYASSIFENPQNIHSQSINIAKHLYERSEHPKIKGGDFHIVLFKNCYFEGQTTDAIGLFKSETKDAFLKVSHDNTGYKIEAEYGININKLDKGCLIFNVDKKAGFSVLTIDNSNRGAEAQYWINDFLHVCKRKDSYNQTYNMLSLCKDFISQIPNQSGKIEKAEYMNRSIEVLKGDAVDINSFAEYVFKNPELISDFKQYKEKYQSESNVEIDNSFATDSSAIKRKAIGTMTTIKLDKNFDINIHGGEQYIVRGYDKERKMYYYQLFFKEEK